MPIVTTLRAATLLVATLTACLAQDPAVENNIPYGEAGGQKLLLDAYRPFATETAPRPAIVFIHGGGWVGGDKKDFRDMSTGAAKLGYVAFSINYRLATETSNHWPAQLDDSQRAVRWVRANAAKYGVDPQRIGALGASAGGHLVAFLGTTDTRDNSDPALAQYSSRVGCVVDMFGPTDLTDDFASKVTGGAAVNDLLRKLLGVRPEEMPAAERAASPLFCVDAKSAPFLIFHGKLDALVPPDHSERLDAALHAAGVESKLILFDNEGHGFNKKENNDRFIAETVAFFKKHLQTP
jgi:acetyl esterase/lipase